MHFETVEIEDVPLSSNHLNSITSVDSIESSNSCTSEESHLSQGSSTSSSSSKKKSVSFSENNNVLLVPSRKEIRSDNLSKGLWWGLDEIDNFRKSALDEIIDVMNSKGLPHAKLAARLLYQP
jgi:hypothetical protein